MQELENASQYAKLLKRFESNEDDVLQCAISFKIQNYSTISESFRSRTTASPFTAQSWPFGISRRRGKLCSAWAVRESVVLPTPVLNCAFVSQFRSEKILFDVRARLRDGSAFLRSKREEDFVWRESPFELSPGEDRKAFRHDPAVKNETNLKYNGCVTFTWLKQDWNKTRSGMSPLWLKEGSLA